MKEIVLDASAWMHPEDFYRELLLSLGAPGWHGHNLDALNETIGCDDTNDVRLPYRIVIVNSDGCSCEVRLLLDSFAELVADLQSRGRRVEFVRTSSKSGH